MNLCRVLVIDDIPAEALTIAKTVHDLRGAQSLRNLGVSLEVEGADSASLSWDLLGQDYGYSPRWDLIVSDVMMPKERSHAPLPVHPQVVDGIPFWTTNIKGNIAKPGIEYGGFWLAKQIALSRREFPNRPMPKVALVSRVLTRAQKREMNSFESENSSWFQYLDKDEVEGVWGPAPGSKLLYRRALLQALTTSKEKSWQNDYFEPSTPEWLRLKTKAWDFAENSRIRHVLIVGPSGCGKSTLAQFLLAKRGFVNLQPIYAKQLDDSGLEPHWTRGNGGLYIDHLEWTRISANNTVFREIERTPDNPKGERRLCVWSANSISELTENKDLLPRFVSLLYRQRIDIGSLVPEEIEQHCEAILRRYAPGIRLTEEVVEELKVSDWPDNLSELKSVLLSAADSAVSVGDSELRLDHLPEHRRRPSDRAYDGGSAHPLKSNELFRKIHQLAHHLHTLKRRFAKYERFHGKSASAGVKRAWVKDELSEFHFKETQIDSIAEQLPRRSSRPKNIATELCSGFATFDQFEIAAGRKVRKSNSK